MIHTTNLATETSLLASALIQSAPAPRSAASTAYYGMRPGESQDDARRRAEAIRAKQVALQLDQVAIKGVDAQGKTVWYTGRAGAGFISEDKSEAFLGFNGEGAAHKAKSLNRFSALHGVRFEADLGV